MAALTVDDGRRACRTRSPTSRIPTRRTSSRTSSAVVGAMNDEAELDPGRRRGHRRHAGGRVAQPHRGRSLRRRRAPASPTSALERADLPDRAPPLGHDVLPVPLRPGPRPAHAPHLGGRPARRRRRRSTPSRRGGATTRASRTRGGTREATGGKIDAMHLTDVDGPQECLAILDQTFVNPGMLWTMSVPGLPRVPAAHRRPARRVRAPRAGAAAPAVGRARAAVGAEVAVPPARARRDRRRASRRQVRGDPPRPGAGAGLELQPHAHAPRRARRRSADPEQIGRDMLELVRQHVDRLVAFDVAQSARGRSPIVHVDYYELVDAPEAVMPTVFAGIGAGVDADGRASGSARGASDNPKGKRGKHEYALERLRPRPRHRRRGVRRLHRAVRHPERAERRVDDRRRRRWAACLDDLARRGRPASAQLRPGDGDTESDADLAVKMFGAVMGAYLTHLWAEPEHPAFLPSVGYHQMYGSPNPDTVYRNAADRRRGQVPDQRAPGHGARRHDHAVRRADRGRAADVRALRLRRPRRSTTTAPSRSCCQRGASGRAQATGGGSTRRCAR